MSPSVGLRLVCPISGSTVANLRLELAVVHDEAGAQDVVLLGHPVQREDHGVGGIAGLELATRRVVLVGARRSSAPLCVWTGICHKFSEGQQRAAGPSWRGPAAVVRSVIR